MALSRAVLIGMCSVKPQGWVMNARRGPTYFPDMAGVRSAEASWKHLMARKLAVQPWLPYWFCSVMQEAYFCPCWHSQETPLVLFYCFHFPVFIYSFFGGWLFIMGPAEKKKHNREQSTGLGGWFMAPCRAPLLLSWVKRGKTIHSRQHSLLLMGHFHVCLPTISPMIDKCSYSCCVSGS